MPHARSFTITPGTLTTLQSYPKLWAAGLHRLTTGPTQLVIVRRLNANWKPSLRKFLMFVEHWLPQVGHLGKLLVSSTDEAHFAGLLGELYLFAHLRQRLGDAVLIPQFQRAQTAYDLEIQAAGHQFAIEVYSPFELSGFQRLCDDLPGILKESPVPRGFHASVEVVQAPLLQYPYAAFWPYDVPTGAEMSQWMTQFAQDFDTWLQGLPAGAVKATRQFPGPPPVVRKNSVPKGQPTLRVELTLTPQQHDRCILLGYSHSTDTSLTFSAPPENLARVEWGPKLKDKLQLAQAGPAGPGRTRILAVNFAHANTSRLSLSCRGELWRQFNGLVNELCRQGAPYDLVLPCSLNLRSHLAVPIAAAPPARAALAAWRSLRLKP